MKSRDLGARKFKPQKAHFQHGQTKPEHDRAKTMNSPGNCDYCGGSHSGTRGNCPASSKMCNNCIRRGHFAKVCHSGKNTVSWCTKFRGRLRIVTQTVTLYSASAAMDNTGQLRTWWSMGWRAEWRQIHARLHTSWITHNIRPSWTPQTNP